MSLPAKAFFIFNVDKDLRRANTVRQVWDKEYGPSEGFWDEENWVRAKEAGPEEIRRLIDSSISNSAVTIVLITSGTADLDYVQYAIRQSRKMKRGVMGIYIHNIRDENGEKDQIGNSRFGEIDKDENGASLYFWQLYPVYRWIIDDGRLNFKNWYQKALQQTTVMNP